MFPDHEIIPGLGVDLYDFFILIGILVAIVAYRVFSERVGMSVKVFNFSLITAVISIILGFASAILFQSFYNFLSKGVWEWQGMTFYGGLIGAIITYLLVYFIGGRFLFKEKENVKQFYKVLSLIVPCIIVAHAFGRIGCLMDGCCYGYETDSFIGISMHTNGVWVKRVPTQLFESIFLFVLFALLLFVLLRYQFEYVPSSYLIGYGAWRFIIEYFRDDPRGSSGIDFLTPSQLTAIVMILGGIAL
ncbi:MAG: prolipoprotein diacylglyceryl transferase, partial [Clostridia bacterium]|nr:prolipoprotein diacylglyceryl transferase [Clostridia bacterium]